MTWFPYQFMIVFFNGVNYIKIFTNVIQSKEITIESKKIMLIKILSCNRVGSSYAQHTSYSQQKLIMRND